MYVHMINMIKVLYKSGIIIIITDAFFLHSLYQHDYIYIYLSDNVCKMKMSLGWDFILHEPLHEKTNNRSDTNRPVQSQKQARSSKF